MALHAAEMCGYEIPDKTRTGAYKWLDRVSNKKSGNVLAGYQSGHTPPMTAEAIFSRILLGQELTQKQIDFFRAYMLQNKPNNGPRNYYYFYYGTLAMHQFQGDQWKQWNQIMSNHLRKTQRKSGQGDGSWDHNGSKWGGGGGRIYSTAMGCLTLEVYYRYLPMHDFNRVKE